MLQQGRLPLAPLLFLLLLLLASAGCWYLTGKFGEAYHFFLWDLTLAWIPVPAAGLFFFLHFLRSLVVRAVLGLLVGAVWLVFFPNSAYLVTEMLHAFRYFEMKPQFWIQIHYWYSVILVFGIASLGLALSSFSLLLMQLRIRVWFGTAAGWLFALGAMLLSSFGIYIGRFLRWNSWDVAARPQMVVTELYKLYQDAPRWNHVVSFVEMFFLVILLSYIIFYVASGMRLQWREKAGGGGQDIAG